MNAYICYFDSLGFEWIFNVTDYEKKKVIAYLKGEEKVDLPIPRYAILRARANPQRFPEIWAFESDLDQEELENVAHESPQVLVNAIRKCGQNIFKTHRDESVIV
jgi:tRNA(Ser,Leu) C12 N-acetylase TAN1